MENLKRHGYCIEETFKSRFSFDGGITHKTKLLTITRDKIYDSLKEVTHAVNTLRKVYPDSTFTFHIIYKNTIPEYESTSQNSN